MKKLFLLSLIVLAAITSHAQGDITAKNLKANAFFLAKTQVWIDSLRNDTTNMQGSRTLLTSKAIYDFVINRIKNSPGGGDADTTTLFPQIRDMFPTQFFEGGSGTRIKTKGDTLVFEVPPVYYEDGDFITSVIRNDSTIKVKSNAGRYPTITDLIATRPSDNAGASTLGYWTKRDGGAADYIYDSASTTTPDSGSVWMPTIGGTGPGRWRMVVKNATVDIKTFGAKGDAATDNQTRIDAAAAYCSAQSFTFFVSTGVFRHNTVFKPAQNLVIQGAGSRLSTMQVMSDTVGIVVSSSNKVTDIRFFGGNTYVGSTGMLFNGGNKAFIQRVRIENFHHAGMKFLNAQNSLIEDVMCQYNGQYNYYLDGTENCLFVNCNSNSDNAMNGTIETLSIYMTGCNNTHWAGGLHERGNGRTQIYVTAASTDASFETMQINNGSVQCILVDGGSSASFEKIQFSNGGGWNVRTTGINSRSEIFNCKTVGANGRGNNKLYSGKNLFSGEIEVPLFSTNFSGSTSGSTVGAGVTLVANDAAQNMTINTTTANSGFETGLGSGSGTLLPGQIVEIKFNIKAIDDSSYIDIYNSYSGGRAFMWRVEEGAQILYYTAKGYESARFGFLNPKSGAHSWTMSGLSMKLLGGADSIAAARITAKLRMGIYTPAVDTAANGTELLNAKQTKDLIRAGGGGGGTGGSVTSVAIASTDLAVAGGPITNSGTFTLNINPLAVTYAKMQNVSASQRIMGRRSGGAGSMEEISGPQVTAMLDQFTYTTKGLLPPSVSGTSTFIRADGIWAPIDTIYINNFHLKVKSLFSGAGPMSYSPVTGVISMAVAGTSASGYLSSTDWNTFNNKISSQWVPATGGINYTGGNVGLANSSPTYKLDVTGDIRTSGQFRSTVMAGGGDGPVYRDNVGALYSGPAIPVIAAATTTIATTQDAGLASLSNATCHYIRIGNEVTVTFNLTLQSTGTGSGSGGFSFFMGLPITSAFTANSDAIGLGGLGSFGSTDKSGAELIIRAEPATTTVKVFGVSSVSSIASSVTGSFQYTIK